MGLDGKGSCREATAMSSGSTYDSKGWKIDDIIPASEDGSSDYFDTVTTGEVIITDPNTGGAKGSKLARHDLVPPLPLHLLAEHYGRGEQKYPSDENGPNWYKGYKWSLSYAAMQRHLNAFWRGEDVDEETGSLHLTAAAWHCFSLIQFFHDHPELDDRAYSDDRT